MNEWEKRKMDVHQAIVRVAREPRETCQWYKNVESVFKAIVKMWICGEEISDVGFVLGKIVEAIEEAEEHE